MKERTIFPVMVAVFITSGIAVVVALLATSLPGRAWKSPNVAKSSKKENNRLPQTAMNDKAISQSSALTREQPKSLENSRPETTGSNNNNNVLQNRNSTKQVEGKKIVDEANHVQLNNRRESKDGPKVSDKQDEVALEQTTEPTRSVSDNDPTVGSVSEKKPAVHKKLSVPDQDAQKKSRVLIADLYKKENEAAKTIEQKSALAARVLRDATESSDDVVGRYVLYQIARELAIQCGEIATSYRAIELTSQEFEVDGLALKADALMRVTKTYSSPKDHEAGAKLYKNIIAQVIASDRYDLAKTVVNSFLVSASISKAPDLVASVERCKKEIEAMETEYAKVIEANKKLLEVPTDPHSNYVAGYYCSFIKGDWNKGLPMLAAGDHQKLKELATQDLNETPDAVSIGNLWWDWAGSTEGSNVKVRAQQRSVFHYNKALPQLKGLTKRTAEARIVEASANQFETDLYKTDEKAAGLAQAPFGNSSKEPLGTYAVTFAGRGQNGFELKPNGKVAFKDGETGKWRTEGDSLILDYDKKAYGNVVLVWKDSVSLVGQNKHANGKIFAWTVSKLPPPVQVSFRNDKSFAAIVPFVNGVKLASNRNIQIEQIPPLLQNKVMTQRVMDIVSETRVAIPPNTTLYVLVLPEHGKAHKHLISEGWEPLGYLSVKLTKNSSQSLTVYKKKYDESAKVSFTGDIFLDGCYIVTDRFEKMDKLIDLD